MRDIYIEVAIYRANYILLLFTYIESVTLPLTLCCFPPAKVLLVMRHTPYPFQHPVKHIQI